MQNSKLNFRKDILESLPVLNKRYEVSDAKVEFLKLSVGSGGTKTFILHRKVKGKPQRIKIGRFNDLTVEKARDQAKKLNSIITLGGDPQDERRKEREQITFKQLYDIYYNEYASVYNKRPMDNRKTVELHVFPAIGNQAINKITSDRIRKLHIEIGEKRAGATANRIIALINSVYNFGIKNEYYKGLNPCLGIKKFRIHSRDRFLSKEELTSFFDAIEQEEELFKHFFQILLFTGARKGNVLAMKWADIDFDLCRWRIPDTHTKNKEVNIVVLSSEVVEILKYRNEQNKKLQIPSAFVFQGDGKDGYLKDPKKAFARIRKRMGKTDIRMHDLRRTLGSYMAISGASIPIIGKALNHKSQVSTAIYARLSQDPVIDAVNLAIKNMQK
jgi:integrase